MLSGPWHIARTISLLRDEFAGACNSLQQYGDQRWPRERTAYIWGWVNMGSSISLWP